MPNIKNNRKVINRILEHLLLEEPMNTATQTELRDLAKGALASVASVVKETDKLLKQVDKHCVFTIGIQMLCHASLCSAQALHNGVTNLGEFWQFEMKSGTAVGKVVPQLRSFRSELEISCMKLSDKVEEQMLIVNLACEPIQGDKELSVLKREIDSVESNLLRFIFFSCAMREKKMKRSKLLSTLSISRIK